MVELRMESEWEVVDLKLPKNLRQAGKYFVREAFRDGGCSPPPGRWSQTLHDFSTRLPSTFNSIKAPTFQVSLF
jgi:hypothetical protein